MVHSLVYLKRFNMCVKCGNKKCDDCNPSCYNPDSSSSLVYDGPKFECAGNFTISPGDSLNDTLNTLFQAACIGAGSGGNFAIQLPRLEEGNYVRVILPALVPVAEYIETVVIDRNLCSEDVIVSWVGLPVEIVQVPLPPASYPGKSSTLELPWSIGNAPVLTVPVGVPVGNYSAILRFTTTLCGIIDLNVQIDVS